MKKYMQFGIKTVEHGLWATSCLLGLVVLIHLISPSFLYSSRGLGDVHAFSPTIKELNGTFYNDDKSRELKMLQLNVRFQPGEDCLVSFIVAEVEGEESVILMADFVGEQYDNDEQQFQIKLDPGTRNKKISQKVPLGENPPQEGVLRIFHSSPSMVKIRDVRVIGPNIKLNRVLTLVFWVSVILLVIFSFILVLHKKAVLECEPNSSKLRRLEFSFVLAFLFLICIPWCQSEFGLFRYEPLNENRNKIEKPGGHILVQLYVEGEEFGKKYEKYFNDTFGMRDFYIRLKNQLDYWFFKRSDEVFIGLKGWMEYRSVLEVEEIRGERLTEDDWNFTKTHFKALEEYCTARGITLILLPIQMKFSIYPEYMPSGKISSPEKTAFLRLLDLLKEMQIHYVDSRTVLLEVKKNYPVFYKTDFHWNEIAAFHVAKEVVNKIGALSGHPRRWPHPLKYHEEEGFKGGLNRSLGVLYPPTENSIVIDRNWEETGQFIKPEPPLGVYFKADSSKEQELLPETLLVGDSFTNYFFENNGFYENFETAYFLHSSNFHNLPAYIPKGVKYLVYQSIEVVIGNHFWNPEWWPVYSEEAMSKQ